MEDLFLSINNGSVWLLVGVLAPTILGRDLLRIIMCRQGRGSACVIMSDLSFERPAILAEASPSLLITAWSG